MGTNVARATRISLLVVAGVASAVIPLPGWTQAALSSAPPLRIVSVSESTKFNIYGRRGVASAPRGTRIVLVTFAPTDGMSQISTDDLGIRIGTRIFGATALGGTERGYCPGRIELHRAATAFSGHCFEGNVGGVEVTGPHLTAGFIVSNDVPLGQSQLLVRFLSGARGLEPGEGAVVSPFSLSVRVVKVSPSTVGVLVDLEVRNGNSTPVPVNPADFRLGERISGSTAWRVTAGYLHDRTTIPADNENGQRVDGLTLAPGESRTIRLTFFGPLAGTMPESQIGYFMLAAIPLPPASSK